MREGGREEEGRKGERDRGNWMGRGMLLGEVACCLNGGLSGW